MELCFCTVDYRHDMWLVFGTKTGLHVMQRYNCYLYVLLQVKVCELWSFPGHQKLVEWYKGTIARLAGKIKNRNKALK